MKREILFRGKSVKDNEWRYTGTFSQVTIDGKEIGIHGGFIFVDDVFENTICQYIGLKDKNGKKIFDGDLVSVLNRKPKEVVYGNRHGCCAYFLKDTDYILNQSFVDSENIVVVGNIYDNPEPLEE